MMNDKNQVQVMDIVRATETLTNYGFDVKAAGFNMLSKFTIIVSEYQKEMAVHAQSIIVNADDLNEVVDYVTKLGRGLVKMIIEMSEVSEFSVNPNLNKAIPTEEVKLRLRRLTSSLEKRGWEYGMPEWDFRHFEEKYPKGYIRCLARAILEGADTCVKCLSCSHVQYLDGGIMKCERTTVSAPVSEDGIPSRLAFATKLEARYHTLYSDIVCCNYNNPCYCMHTKATKEELMKKHNK